MKRKGDGPRVTDGLIPGHDGVAEEEGRCRVSAPTEDRGRPEKTW
jgi:hypothetical protein